ncbi:MAG: DUF3244 domain-containing protein [Bacteroidaceae bacterium]|nr:DUF3244 domain-containing protein [Bacteroidaceae bacterium]
MNKRTILMLFTLLTTFIKVQGGDIDLIPPFPPGDGNDGNGRSTEFVVTANYNDHYLTISFNDYSSSRIVVEESSTNVAVFDQQYGLNTGLHIDLSSVSLGGYTLFIYAYGYCWTGEFSIE